ncbi:putative ATPase/histidine kinase/DNA gyrase B/HSP90 domain protein [uncultured Desulfatiglans sp.]|nr:putative ATPase/histidine kinase/DNA gyrase B/HSP90 domain protein [uncultured Desulfatiglans sp.]
MEMNPRNQAIRVLLVEDDEDDYVIFRDTLLQITGSPFQLEWVSTCQEAVEKATLNQHDVCLVDYLLGEKNGIELTHDFQRNGVQAPVILLTGQGSHEVDMKAMKEGVADYLEKIELNPMLLERAIRYAIDRSKTLQALRESEQQLRILSAKILETQENERRIIAQELHDSIGASLSAIRYGLEEKLLRMGDDRAAPEGIGLERIIGIVHDTIEEVYRISSNLRPSVLDDMGLLAAIGSLCRELQGVYRGVRIETQVDVREDDVHRSLGIVIYRILQEALNNAFKHSRANTIQVRLRKTEGFLELSITDNGEGFDPAGRLKRGVPTEGMGLIGMKERAELSNGVFEIRSETGQGMTVRVTWLAIESQMPHLIQ